MKMRYTQRANVEKLTKQWDSGNLKDCYCLIFSHIWGFQIIWNDENGQSHTLKDNCAISTGYFVVLAVYETEKQAKDHFADFIKWTDAF